MPLKQMFGINHNAQIHLQFKYCQNYTLTVILFVSVETLKAGEILTYPNFMNARRRHIRS